MAAGAARCRADGGRRAGARAGIVPTSWHLNGIQHIYQGWNNCGPATLTMGLTYYGYSDDQ